MNPKGGLDMKFLLATGAYGRQSTATDWLNGKDFRLDGSGTYFSIRDADVLVNDGIEEVHFLNRHGFLAFTVYTSAPNKVYK
jgi:hypothetical protein